MTRHGILAALLNVTEIVAMRDSAGLSTTQIAHAAGYSENYLNRIFRGFLGEGLGGIIRRMRLERAAELLVAGHPVKDAAHEAGHLNSAAFSRAFVNAFKIPPSKFSKSARAHCRLPSPNNVHWLTGSDGRGKLQIDFKGIGFLIERSEAKTAAILPFRGWYRDARTVFLEIEKLIDIEQATNQNCLPVCIYHDDGIDSEDLSDLRADVGILCPTGYRPPEPMDIVTLPSGIYVSSAEQVTAATHNLVWCTLNELLVPKTSCDINIPGYDVYLNWPLPWSEMRARIFIRLDQDTQP